MNAYLRCTTGALVFGALAVIFQGTPVCYAFAVAAAVWEAAALRNGIPAMVAGARRWREERRRGAGWTPQDEAILRGERRLPSAPRRCGRCTLWENVPCICGDIPCPSPSCPAREVKQS